MTQPWLYYPYDHATVERQDRCWRQSHPWLCLFYRLLGLSILLASAVGVVRAVAWMVMR